MSARRVAPLAVLSIAALVASVLALVLSLVLPPLLVGGAGAPVPSEPPRTSPPWSPSAPSTVPPSAGATSPSPSPSPSPATASAADAALAQLASLPPTDGSVTVPDYRRDEFGGRWADVDGNGCDQRNDVLARDLDAVTFFANRPCVVQAGVLQDPYTGAAIAFQHGAETSQAVQIDHLVPLALAWRSGAWAWSPEERERFSNDTSLLLAVDGASNQSRSDSDLDEWLPPVEGSRCGFVVTIVDGLARYDLTITASARASAEVVLRRCGEVQGIVPTAGAAADPVARRAGAVALAA